MHVSINWHNYFCCALFVCVCVSLCMYVKSLQSCLTLCNAADCSLPGFFVHGILQARTLKWVALLQGIFPTQGSNHISYVSSIDKWVLCH